MQRPLEKAWYDMPSIAIKDDVLAPNDTLTVRFEGRNPFAASSIVPQMLRQILKITAKDVLETDVRWDNTKEIRQFYGKWMGKRKEDYWTTTIIEIIIQGEQEAKEKTGWSRIGLRGTIQTNYGYSNFIQRMFWWFYNRAFYYKQRRAYIDQGKDFIMQMRDRFQRTLGILPPA